MIARNLRVFSIALVLALVGGLLLVATTAVMAQENSGRRGVYGNVGSIDGNTAVIERPSGDEVTIDATGLDLAVGDRIAALIEPGAEGEPAAVIRSMIRSDEPQFEHVTGAVVTKTANSMTIIDATGRTHVVNLPEGVTVSVEPGDLATVVTSNGDGNGAQFHDAIPGQAIADLAKEHAAALKERAENGEIPVSTAEERTAFLQDILDAISAHLEAVLDSLLGKVSDQAQDAVTEAFGQGHVGFEQAGADVAAQGPPEDPGRPEDTPGERPE